MSVFTCMKPEKQGESEKENLREFASSKSNEKRNKTNMRLSCNVVQNPNGENLYNQDKRYFDMKLSQR